MTLEIWLFFGAFGVLSNPLYELLSNPRASTFASDGSRVDLARLAAISQRIESLPGVYFWLPKTSHGAKVAGTILIAIGFLPLLILPVVIWLFKFIWEHHVAGPEILFLYLIYVSLFQQVVRTGVGILSLPGQCKNLDWPIKQWLLFTRNMPSEATFLANRLNFHKATGLYAAAMISAGIPLALCLLPLAILPLMSSSDSAILVFGLCIFAYKGSLRLSKMVERAAMKFATVETQAQDAQSPIVYLRAFKDDSGLSSLDGLHTVEERIVLALMSAKKRVVALGKPGEKLPPIGAERFYVDDDVWQSTISNWIDNCHAVVMIASVTDATGWEIEEVFRANRQDRFLILFVKTKRTARGKRTLSEMNANDYSTVRTIYDRLKAIGVPNLDWNRDWQQMTPTDLLIAVTFQSDGSPIFVTSDRRNHSAYEEAIKWHLASLYKQ
jgi:hypothetical protein